ncbi:MAG: hypothetical protein KAH10_04010 [Flavobacteriales bacterium]|nr:hypothetical protein [Flavobacteriales bacterium]
MKKLLLSLLLFPSLIFAQYTPADKTENDKTLTELSDYKNTIRWNVTPMVLFGARNVNLGYERVISDKETVSINVGYLEIPELSNTSEQIEYVDGNKDRGGFSIFVDYKRYIGNRNKRKAPEGIYWGAFSGIYNQKISNNYKTSFTAEDGTVFEGSADLKATINSYNLGLQLGYQFVFYDRFTVDLILIGPAASVYTGKLSGKFEGNLDESQEFLDFIEKVYEKLPWLEDSIDGDELHLEGSTSNFAIFGSNFRYVVQIGYRF